MKNFIKKNRTIAITLVAMMIIIAGSVIYIGIVKADFLNQLKAVQTQADADIKKLNESKSTSENDLKTAQAEIEKLNSKIDELEKKLSDAELEMEAVEAEQKAASETTDKKVTTPTTSTTTVDETEPEVDVQAQQSDGDPSGGYKAGDVMPSGEIYGGTIENTDDVAKYLNLDGLDGWYN